MPTRICSGHFWKKWSSKVFCLIRKEESVRYTDFRNLLEGISDPVLASTLKLLIQHGIVERKSYDEMPIRVEYSLTEKGKSAIPVLEGLCKWTALYRDEHDKDILHLCADCPIWK